MSAPPPSSPFINPLLDFYHTQKVAESCLLVIFGATGDLTARKLLPALYNLSREGMLPPRFGCVGIARREKTHETFRKEVRESLEKFSRSLPIDERVWDAFSQQIFYFPSEFNDDAGFERLEKFLSELDLSQGTEGNRVFYLSTAPHFFPEIVQKLHQHGLISNEQSTPWNRVIVEKPFGIDLHSAQELQNSLLHYLKEKQIYRIDHYLGKETVQNLLIFRFGNSIFESIWNNHYIDHVQITVAEDIGIGSRGKFFEEAGILRDIVQNHMMQLLSLIAMEPPANLQPDSIQNEKVKLLECICPIHLENSLEVVRGQYGPGISQGEWVKGYRAENDVAPNSYVETFAALRLSIDNWRWAGVPFFLRAGKRLVKRATEIAVFLKRPPHNLFSSGRAIDPNVIIIRIQPDEGIALKMNCKLPYQDIVLQPVKMDFQYGAYFGKSSPEAYERLISDCMAGDNTLFARADEVFASWKLLTPVLQHWAASPPKNFPNYSAGSWGPLEADLVLASQGAKWRMI